MVLHIATVTILPHNVWKMLQQKNAAFTMLSSHHCNHNPVLITIPLKCIPYTTNPTAHCYNHNITTPCISEKAATYSCCAMVPLKCCLHNAFSPALVSQCCNHNNTVTMLPHHAATKTLTSPCCHHNNAITRLLP